ncbi:MAG: MotA/TolQ/ExbB proton channel family protein, partial [Roseivivax sp.]|nr:MotA/TolQ/ExbB proton channel family protein [Roseivivax sp.]
MGALQTFGAGGPILIVLAVMSVLSLAAIIVKTAQLAPVLRGDGSRTAALAQWAGGDRLGAMAALGPGKAPADRVLLSAMQALDKGHGGAALISALTQRGNAEYTRMTSLIRTLELTAMISPLLGLLGTVLG